MRSKYIRFLALLLCAALLGCLLAACGGSADSSPASSAAPASDSASASGSSELPSSTTEANTGELNPGNFDENSVFSITGTENAFAPCLGWGPGVSGCSLKSVIAAASLLQWAEGARMSSRSPEAIQDAFYSWYDGLTDNEQEGFAEAWPLIKDAALDLLSDKDSMTARIADAGLDADTLPGCTLKNWQALQTVLDGIVPASCTHSNTASGDWASWLAQMNGAKVTVTVTNYGDNTCDVVADVVGTEGLVSQQKYTGIPVESADLYLDFTVDGCYYVFDKDEMDVTDAVDQQPVSMELTDVPAEVEYEIGRASCRERV